VWELPSVVRCRVDMCMFGLQVSEHGLSKKPTGILTNDPALAARLEKSVCLGLHPHVPLERGLPRKAQVYTPLFVKAVIAGLRESFAVREPMHSFPEVNDEEIDDDGEEGEGDKGAEPSAALPLPPAGEEGAITTGAHTYTAIGATI